MILGVCSNCQQTNALLILRHPVFYTTCVYVGACAYVGASVGHARTNVDMHKNILHGVHINMHMHCM